MPYLYILIMKVRFFTAQLKMPRVRAGRFVTSWKSVQVPAPVCSLIAEQVVGIFKEA